MRSLAWRALESRSRATLARAASSAGAFRAWRPIQAAYSLIIGPTMARTASADSAAARASMPSSTPSIWVGMTFSTSAVGIQAVRTSRQRPVSSVTATAETL